MSIHNIIHSYIHKYIIMLYILFIHMYILIIISFNINSYFNSNIYKYIMLNIIMKIADAELLKLIKTERIVTSSEVAEKFSVSWNTAEKHLMELLISEKVERIKKAGVTLWMLS